MADFAAQREQMVREQIAGRGLDRPRLLDAFRAVPRELFVPESVRLFAYEDGPLPIEAGQTISQPYIVARMTELLECDRASRILEIGAGSGYQTAVLARVAGQVYAIERIAELARQAQARIRSLGVYNATVKCFDGTMGWSAHAPYDGVLVAAGGPEVPEPLLAQLKVGGRLVIPVGASRESQRLVRVIREEEGYRHEEHGACAFVPLIGRYGWSNAT